VPGYDYSTPGTHFVTICAEHRACIFGSVADGVMTCNDVGQMVEEFWTVLPSKSPEVEIDEYVVMPNHMHGILRLGWMIESDAGVENDESRPTLSRIVQWYKSITTSAYGKQVRDGDWPPYPGRMWQRNYFEHIVRSEANLEKLGSYVEANPGKWLDDSLHNPDCRGFW
jgi:REP element-mobilizing transposase RayT